MNKKIILLFSLLLSGFAFSQTTVTLQDQCNCEVLSGTAVSTPGVTTPSGADIGDIYVNTTSGTIFFWDGNSWELTSSDNQQIQNFSFNSGTNQLTLTLENGGTLLADLSSLASVSTDDQTLSEVLTEGASAGGNAITNLLDPTAAQDAATKNYVDGISTDDADADPTNEIQDAAGVDFTPAGNTSSTDVQAAIEELQIDIDGFAATAGQTNTASNVGTGGVGVFARKTGADLEFKNINAGSNKITITNDAGNDEIDIDINEANLTITESQISDLSHTTDTDDQTLSEVLTEGASAGGNAITNLLDPTAAQDAATKNYVDGISTDDADADPTNEIQDASEVNSDAPVDVDGDGATETTVEDVIQAIAPIVSKAARIFYPPSIAVDASSTGAGTPVNLYAQYLAQYGTPAVKSPSAPAAIPTYTAGELYYYITYYDPTVFSGVSVTDTGIMNFTVDTVPTDYNSLINVVFVVK